MCVCVCVCVREREREREDSMGLLPLNMRDNMYAGESGIVISRHNL